MRVTLVNAPVKVYSPHARLSPPLGLAYLAAALLDAGHRVTAVDFNISGLNMRRVDSIITHDRPDIVGISAVTETYPNALAIARRLKELEPRTIVVMGGAHPSIVPEQVLAEGAVDYVVAGAGEGAMTELLAHLEHGIGRLEDIGGLGYISGGQVCVNPRGPLPDPDLLPLPVREVFPLELYTQAVNVLTATGSCPYRCPFCSAASIWAGRRRTRSPRLIVEELTILAEEYGIDRVFFTDDIFTLNKDWVRELLNELRAADHPVAWECATRADLVDAELLSAMAHAGCVGIQFGVESGARDILDSVKGVSKEQVREAVRAATTAGIHAVCSFMTPFPEDTAETLEETGTFMKELHDAGSEVLLSYTTPYPGTYFHDHADELGLHVLTDQWDEFDAKHVVMETRHLRAAEIEATVERIATLVGMRWSVEHEPHEHLPDGTKEACRI